MGVKSSASAESLAARITPVSAARAATGGNLVAAPAAGFPSDRSGVWIDEASARTDRSWVGLDLER